MFLPAILFLSLLFIELYVTVHCRNHELRFGRFLKWAIIVQFAAPSLTFACIAGAAFCGIEIGDMGPVSALALLALSFAYPLVVAGLAAIARAVMFWRYQE